MRLLSFAASAALLISVTGAASVASISHRPPGFVYRSGQNFAVDGRKFFFTGSNAYWFSFLDNIQDVSYAMDKAKAAGLSIIRTWGFRDLNETFIPGGLPQYGGEGAGPSTIYFQSWKDGVATINYGDNGLKRLDQLVALAEKKSMKLLFALTNNWADYGGMDVYTVNLGGKFHDDFFVSRPIIAAYKRYIKAVVTRFKSSPAVFAWELGNEPRCGADGVRNLPRSANCSSPVITAWAREITDYIRSLDPHHLIAVGDEGFFTAFSDETAEDWAYNGKDGVDNIALAKLPNVDFGTFHSYPDWWSKTPEWATQWHRDHALAQRRVGKPFISEEYGWLSPEKRLEYLGLVSNYTRIDALGPLQKVILEDKIAADMYWQLGVQDLSFGNSTDDGFTIYLTSPEAKVLIWEHAKKMNRRAGIAL